MNRYEDKTHKEQEEEPRLNRELTKINKKNGGEEVAPDLLAIKKLKVWWYTFSKDSAPLSFSDRLNKGRYQSCHGLSRVVGTKNVTNQTCLCVHMDVNNIKWRSIPARPAHAKMSLVIVEIKNATRKR